jgi:rod shape determining protein RodA
MFSFISKGLKQIDWILFASATLIVGAGLITMNSFAGNNYFFEKQSVIYLLAVIAFMVASFIDWRFLRRTGVVVGLFIGIVAILATLFAVGSVFKGAQSWFNLGLFAFQPSDPAKLVLIIVLAKYFSRRHVEIAHIRHILVSAFYAFVIFALVFLQPDFGSAVILAMVWLGMVMVSGISKKHLLGVFLLVLISFGGLWTYVFKDYQKERILNFVHPLADVQGTGYNAYQSTIAVGSGQVVGKGIGFGTQSKLQFLPEYETDFIFAAYAEEWGFIGVVILFTLFGLLFWRIIANSSYGATNFEVLFGLGVAVLFLSHIIIHVGMNIGLLPVTGTTIPLMSYGGSHLLTEFLALGMVVGMRRYAHSVKHTPELE